MSITKERQLVAGITIQFVLIIVLEMLAINFRTKLVGAQAGADYYRKALVELHDDHEAALEQILLYQRQDLRREYVTALDIAVRYGVITGQEAASRQINFIENRER
jgi:hypothetical protein